MRIDCHSDCNQFFSPCLFFDFSPHTRPALLQQRANAIPFVNVDGSAPSNAADFGGFYFDGGKNDAVYNGLFTVSREPCSVATRSIFLKPMLSFNDFLN
jgi:hypothetical protein